MAPLLWLFSDMMRYIFIDIDDFLIFLLFYFHACCHFAACRFVVLLLSLMPFHYMHYALPRHDCFSRYFSFRCHAYLISILRVIYDNMPLMLDYQLFCFRLPRRYCLIRFATLAAAAAPPISRRYLLLLMPFRAAIMIL